MKTPATLWSFSPRERVTLLALAVLALLPFALPSSWTTIAINIAYGIYLCVAWNVIAGFAGQFALGQPVFLAIGAYSSAVLLQYHVTPWIGMLAGAALSGLAAAGFGHLAFRYRVRGLYFALLTFASLVVAANLAVNAPFLGGGAGLILPLGNSWQEFVWRARMPYYVVMLALLVVAFAVSVLVARTSMGWRLEAIRQDEEAASAIGIDVCGAKTKAFVVSAMLTSLIGTFYAQFYQLVSPDTVLTFDPQITMLLGTYIGGVGTIIGPLVGGLAVSAFNQFLQALPLDSRVAATSGQALFALFLIAISIYAPRGIVGLAQRKGVTRRVNARPSAASVEEF